MRIGWLSIWVQLFAWHQGVTAWTVGHRSFSSSGVSLLATNERNSVDPNCSFPVSNQCDSEENCSIETRRRFVGSLATTTLATTMFASSASAKSRTDGYAVQHTEREWAYLLSGLQYNILRKGGTERQRSSILYSFSRPGTYLCAGCMTPLFASEAKFDSGTGWPSFSSALASVEVEDLDPIRATLDGREVRCGTCGGHLGDLFNDGWIFVNTSAFATRKRYCIDGAALVFRPVSDDSGDSDVYGDRPPPNKVILYEPSLYRD